MKVSKGQSQSEIAADIRLLNSLHVSGFTICVPGFDCDPLTKAASVTLAAQRMRRCRFPSVGGGSGIVSTVFSDRRRGSGELTDCSGE